MFLGIEIGGTKLQVGVGDGIGGPLAALERTEVRPEEGAEGIRRQIRKIGNALVRQYDVDGIGIGFGGPVDRAAGQTLKSHQISGWDRFPLTDWCHETLGRPAGMANDADMAGLAEARFGAGRGKKIVFYITVGSGIGGALVIDQRVYGGSRGVASELGHLRPGPEAGDSAQTVESIASGWGITAAARADAQLTAELKRRLVDPQEPITGKLAAEAARDGNPRALAVFQRATQTLGWAVAQMITLVSPEAVVIGGGVSLAGESLFFAPLREAVHRYVFPPLRESYAIRPAALGETVVVYGALALARAQTEMGGMENLFLPALGENRK